MKADPGSRRKARRNKEVSTREKNRLSRSFLRYVHPPAFARFRSKQLDSVCDLLSR